MSLSEKLKKISGEPDSTFMRNLEKRIATREERRHAGMVALEVMDLLDKQQLTQKELGERMGVSRQQVSKILKGDVNLTLETIGKLERALGVTLINVVDNDETETALLQRPELPSMRFTWKAIAIDEFAITDTPYNPTRKSDMHINLSFTFADMEQSVKCRLKSMFYQGQELLLTIAVSSNFVLLPEDWKTVLDEENRVYQLPRIPAMHFAELTFGAMRGALHTKTENQLLQSISFPAIDLVALIREDIRLAM